MEKLKQLLSNPTVQKWLFYASLILFTVLLLKIIHVTIYVESPRDSNTGLIKAFPVVVADK